MLVQILDKYALYNFFIRPRRFGKSLFISMIENYYNINKKAKFEELFSDLYMDLSDRDLIKMDKKNIKIMQA